MLFKAAMIFFVRRMHPHSFHSTDKPNFVDYHDKEDNSIIIIAWTQDKNDNKKIIINNDEDNMVRFSAINDDPWWKEQEPHDDHDDADMSPQMIRTTTDLAISKNVDIPSNLQGEFELFPKPDEIDVAIERRDEKEETNCLDQIDKARASREAKAKLLVSDIDAKDNTEDHYPPSDCAHKGCHFDDSQVDNEEDDDDGDNSSIASSSSSAVFEFFDDVSMLTDMDSIGDEDDKDNDNDDFHINMHSFEDIPLLTEDIGKRRGKEGYTIVYSLGQGDFFEDHHYKEEEDSMEDFIIEGEKNICKALKDHILLDFLVGFCYEEGFSPKDQLRLA